MSVDVLRSLKRNSVSLVRNKSIRNNNSLKNITVSDKIKAEDCTSLLFCFKKSYLLDCEEKTYEKDKHRRRSAH